MPQKPLILAVSIVLLHLLNAATLSTTPAGSLVANLLEISACGLAAAMAFGAFRRGRGMSRPFWLLVGTTPAIWGLANVGWTYYEAALHSEPPATSVVRFLFGVEGVLLGTALFLDQEKDSSRIDAESALDFIQFGIVFFLIYLEFYYLPAHHLNVQAAFFREIRVENVEDALLTALSGLQALRARKRHIRKLYSGLFFYLLTVTVCAATAEHLTSIKPAPTGTLRDLLWLTPFLSFALWAAYWQPGPEERLKDEHRRRTLGELLVTNATFALGPLIIIFQMSQLGAEWRQLHLSLLGVSILCFAARLGMSQQREGKISDERLEAEKARSETEAKFKMFVEQVAAVSYIAEVGVHGKWLYISPQVEESFGYTPEEWLSGSENWLARVPEEDHSVIHPAEEDCAKGKRFQAEYRLKRKDGQVIWVSDTAALVPGSESHPLMEGIIVDITERRQMENHLQQARRMEAVGRLAGGVAHDFNNLLTIIKGYAELALNRAAGQSELEGNVRQIADASDRAVTLVRQLLAFSRKQVLKPTVLDLNSIVLSTDKLLRRLVTENIEMKTRVGKDIGAVKADPSQLEQVILNLVVNARDAMPRGGKLIIETSGVDLGSTFAQDQSSVTPGPYVILSVTDTGVGMSAETMAHIFEPFYTTKSGERTGLGLATVYGIVKQTGGHIAVYSEHGKGTTFKVYLPRVAEAVHATAVPERSDSPSVNGHETILLVEDERAVRELARTVLADRGYSVIEARSPEEAVRLADDHGSEIHLLLTDVVMPGMSGYDLAKRLKAQLSDLRVLYMSGYAYDVFAEKGALKEESAFLQKPFAPSVLAQRVRETLDRQVEQMKALDPQHPDLRF